MKIKLLNLLAITMMISACTTNKNETNSQAELASNETVIDKAVNTEIKCNGKEKKNQLSILNLKGKVKYIIEKEYTAVYNFEKVEKENEKILYHDVIRFDTNGNELYSLNYHPNDGSEGQKYIFKYDEYCNKIEELGYNENDQFTGKYVFVYENDNIVEKQYYDEKNILWNKTIYKYDKNSNAIEDETIYKDGRKDKSVYKYNDSNYIIETKCYDKDGLIGKWNYEYDEYDKEGNYTRKITFHEDKPQKIVIREIAYFK